MQFLQRRRGHRNMSFYYVQHKDTKEWLSPT
nr:MAG TPA: hypothetical protein [Caudoviricetes sp.]